MRSRARRTLRFLRDALELVAFGVGALTLRSICVGADLASASIRFGPSSSSTRRSTSPRSSGSCWAAPEWVAQVRAEIDEEFDSEFGDAARGVRGGAT